MTEALRAAGSAAQSSPLILLDLSAAFDAVNHCILLFVLFDIGILDKVLSWFKFYFAGCSLMCPHKCALKVAIGTLLFAIYTISLGPIIGSHGFLHHCL